MQMQELAVAGSGVQTSPMKPPVRLGVSFGSRLSHRHSRAADSELHDVQFVGYRACRNRSIIAYLRSVLTHDSIDPKRVALVMADGLCPYQEGIKRAGG